MMVVDLSQSFFPHSKESQLARGPKRKQSSTENKRAYDDAIKAALDPKTGSVICGICGELCKEGDFAMDHVVPRGRGGKTVVHNLQPAHPACHEAEHAKGKRKKTKAPTQPVIRKTDA